MTVRADFRSTPEDGRTKKSLALRIQGQSLRDEGVDGGQETRRRVRREIQVMRACASPYLPKFGPIPLRELGLKEGPKILYFLEEYIEGTPLASVYKPMPYAEVARLGSALLRHWLHWRRTATCTET